MAKITSVKKVPFTPDEQRALKMMSDLPNHKRRPLKEEFCEANGRHPEEVAYYLKSLAQSKRWARNNTSDTSGSIAAPKEQVTEIAIRKISSKGKSVSHLTREMETKREIRITFKSIRVEGTTMIFEV